MIEQEIIIERLEDELQFMESCLGQGFTLKDYIDRQKHLIEILKALYDDRTRNNNRTI